MMKEKILKAIDKGLMNVLSTNIEDQDIDFNHDDISNEYTPYEYRTVDMGTGVLWCEYNLGAYPGLKPKDWYGDYYAWGETEIKDGYSWETYKYCKGTKDTMTKYNENDRLKLLEPKDDVVSEKLGNKFRMPTKEEFQDLIDKTINEWVENYKGINGLNGRLFTAENGNTLFFPAAGSYGSSIYNNGSYGYVWSASINSFDTDYAWYLYFHSDGFNTYDYSRYSGNSVRGVKNSPLAGREK